MNLFGSQEEGTHYLLTHPICFDLLVPKLGFHPRLSITRRYALPFDRHDWIVERNGKDVRYVIDFYSAPPQEGKLVGIHIDARPGNSCVSTRCVLTACNGSLASLSMSARGK